MNSLRTLLARQKRKLFKKPFIRDKRYPAFWMDKFLGDTAFLVQIGSNDGKTGDPLYPLLQKNKGWEALFVEPVPQSFEQLKANYPDKTRFRFENVAINEGQQMDFYFVGQKAREVLPELPYWFDQIGSFDKQHILKHFDGALAPYIQTVTLEGIRLGELLERNKIEQIDVLHIDTEGYDWKILSQLDLERYKPQFILYEHNHLSQDAQRASIQFLQEKYTLFQIGIDTLAVHHSLNTQKMQKYMGKPLKI